MSKKPRGKPVLMEYERPVQRRQNPRHKHVVKDEFRNCNFPGCPNIVSVQELPGYSGPVVCILHRGEK